MFGRKTGREEQADFFRSPFDSEAVEQADEHEGGADQEEAEAEEEATEILATLSGNFQPLGDILEHEPARFRLECSKQFCLQFLGRGFDGFAGGWCNAN